MTWLHPVVARSTATQAGVQVAGLAGQSLADLDAAEIILVGRSG
jgi:hypothetical protein